MKHEKLLEDIFDITYEDLDIMLSDMDYYFSTEVRQKFQDKALEWIKRLKDRMLGAIEDATRNDCEECMERDIDWDDYNLTCKKCGSHSIEVDG